MAHKAYVKVYLTIDKDKVEIVNTKEVHSVLIYTPSSLSGNGVYNYGMEIRDPNTKEFIEGYSDVLQKQVFSTMIYVDSDTNVKETTERAEHLAQEKMQYIISHQKANGYNNGTSI